VGRPLFLVEGIGNPHGFFKQPQPWKMVKNRPSKKNNNPPNSHFTLTVDKSQDESSNGNLDGLPLRLARVGIAPLKPNPQWKGFSKT
jgi:hypothetical protein